MRRIISPYKDSVSCRLLTFNWATSISGSTHIWGQKNNAQHSAPCLADLISDGRKVGGHSGVKM